MAEANDVKKQISDMIECSICSETFTQPRILPCVHSFCVKCIVEYGKDKKPGEHLACPLCRAEFTVPAGGLGELPKNFFIEGLCDINRSSTSFGVAAAGKLCEACPEGKTDQATPTNFCMDCQQQLCADCTSTHKKLRFATSHKVVGIGTNESREMLLKSTSRYCTQHTNERISLFCSDCSLSICLICYVSSHKSHECSDVEMAAGHLDKQLQSNKEKTEDLLRKITERTRKVVKDRDAFAAEIKKTEDSIISRADHLKRVVDEHTRQLLEELNCFSVKTSKEFEQLRQELEFHKLMLENMHTYIDEVRTRGNAADVCKAAADVEVKTKEVLAVQLKEFGPIIAIFVPTNVSDSGKNVVGTVKTHSSDSGNGNDDDSDESDGGDNDSDGGKDDSDGGDNNGDSHDDDGDGVDGGDDDDDGGDDDDDDDDSDSDDDYGTYDE